MHAVSYTYIRMYMYTIGDLHVCMYIYIYTYTHTNVGSYVCSCLGFRFGLGA